MQHKNAKGRLKKSHQNINGRNFSGSFLSKSRWNKYRERFFRRPLNLSVECVPQGTHAVGWDCRENEERVRAYRTHPTCGLRLTETSTTGIFQAAFIARQMEQMLRAFFQTTFEPIGRVCATRHARGGLRLQRKWRTRACVVPHTPYMRATTCCFLYLRNTNG